MYDFGAIGRREIVPPLRPGRKWAALVSNANCVGPNPGASRLGKLPGSFAPIPRVDERRLNSIAIAWRVRQLPNSQFMEARHT